MKRLFRAALLAGCLSLCGCAGESKPLLHEAREDLERGVTGGGTLYEPAKTDDPFIRGQRQ